MTSSWRASGSPFKEVGGRPSSVRMSDSRQRTNGVKMARPVGGGTLVAIAVGLLGIALYAGIQGRARFLTTVSVALMVALACLMVGGVLGLLFGIPRAGRADLPEGDGRSAMPFRPNTNLEDISDWLTKILVGVGLIQLGQLSEPLGRLVTAVAEGIGGDPPNPSFTLALLLYFTLVGFLAGYLLTRLYLPRAFTSAQQLLDLVTRKAEDTVDRRLHEQAERDAKAISLIDRQLHPTPGDPPMSEEELIKAIKEASPSVKAQAFLRARNQRRDNYRNNKEVMEQTIPLFRALIASDPERRFHRNHGQLGFALKDQRTPDWSKAQDELTEAIAIRGTPGSSYHLYEANRAICRINQDPAQAAGHPSAPETKEAIVADLRVANMHPIVHHRLANGKEFPDVHRWAALNDVNLADLWPSA
jgi:hypothetical protein